MFHVRGAGPSISIDNTAFAHVSIDPGWTVPLEITVLGLIPPPVADSLIEQIQRGMERHVNYVDEFNEPSAKIGNTSILKGDRTALYTFMVKKKDLVFHTHAGHRAITGITGGKGSTFKFSLCHPEEAQQNPQAFVDKLVYVQMPPGCQWTLRFDGRIYHQFCPGGQASNAFTAVSVHTDEMHGLPPGEILRLVEEGHASIPLLTIPISEEIEDLLEKLDHDTVPLVHYGPAPDGPLPISAAMSARSRSMTFNGLRNVRLPPKMKADLLVSKADLQIPYEELVPHLLARTTSI
jgi:hypothetical protein